MHKLFLNNPSLSPGVFAALPVYLFLEGLCCSRIFSPIRPPFFSILLFALSSFSSFRQNLLFHHPPIQRAYLTTTKCLFNIYSLFPNDHITIIFRPSIRNKILLNSSMRNTSERFIFREISPVKIRSGTFPSYSTSTSYNVQFRA